MGCSWEPVTLGRSGLVTPPLGVAASYGIGEKDVEHAFDRGVRLYYWGSRRARGFGRGLRTVARRDRARVVTVIQTYTRAASLMRPSLEIALRQLGTDYTDILLLGWWNKVPPARILDAAVRLKEAGKARAIMVSCHDRPTFVALNARPELDALMVRYNAAHPGAETEVFPHLGDRRAGVVAYTATRWGHLPDPRLTPPGEKTPRASDCYRFCL